MNDISVLLDELVYKIVAYFVFWFWFSSEVKRLGFHGINSWLVRIGLILSGLAFIGYSLCRLSGLLKNEFRIKLIVHVIDKSDLGHANLLISGIGIQILNVIFEPNIKAFLKNLNRFPPWVQRLFWTDWTGTVVLRRQPLWAFFLWLLMFGLLAIWWRNGLILSSRSLIVVIKGLLLLDLEWVAFSWREILCFCNDFLILTLILMGFVITLLVSILFLFWFLEQFLFFANCKLFWGFMGLCEDFHTGK